MKVHFRVLSLIGTVIVLIVQMGTVTHGLLSSNQLFGCQRYGGVMHCDLLLNDLEATEAQGNSSLINNLTSKDVMYVNGKTGQSMEMRGEYRESVEIMNSSELNPNQFSISFWMRSTTIEPYGVIVSHSNRPQTSGWQFDTFKAASSQSGSEAATLRFAVFNTNGTSFSPPTVEIPKDRFTLITGTFDGTRVKLFMDGQLVGEREFRGSYYGDPGLPMRIGSPSYCSSCNRWSGIIDDLRMYERILADQEVRQLYDMSDVVSGLIGYWKFDGDTNDSMQRHNGTAITMLTNMVFAPDGRLFFNEKNTGEIRVMTPQQIILDKPFASVNDLFASWEQGMLGLAIDPEFESNHYVYLYYTALIDTQNDDGGKVINRVVRFTDINNTGTDMTVILDNIPASRGYHSGGAMTFGPDGKLYITVGDATEHIFAQDPSIVIGKVLRINKDGSIPADNPYPNLPVYTIGHRNLYGIAFDNNGTGLVGENGEARYDEINLITKGGNYGFPTSQPANLPPERSNDSSIKPLRSYWDTIAPTQMIYYTGDAVPELKGMFLFGSFTGDIYALKMSKDGKRIDQEIHIDLEHYPFVPTVGIAQSPDGKIYYGGYQIYTLDSIGEREQALFTIGLGCPPGVDIGEIKVDEEQKKITIDADLKEPLDSNATLTARIPRALLDNITNVAAESKQGPNVMEFSVNELGPDDTTIGINIGSTAQNAGTIELVISQTQTGP
jgi:glucose/arabinose dehydrogenase